MTLRATDRREIAATSGSRPLDAITRCVEQSEHCWAGLIGGRVVFVGGVSHASMTGRRSPWLLGADELERHPAAFLRYCVEKMPQVRAAYPWLENYVDARASTTIRWLKWLGFTVHAPVPYGILRRPFHRFDLRS
jgi:hypothetical protein